MKINKRKKSLKLLGLSTFFATVSVTAASVTLSSCVKKADLKIPSSTASSFSSLSSSILPTIAGVLSSKVGQNSLVKTYINETLMNWFEVVNESTIETNTKNWRENAQKAYDNEYNSYKKDKGANWEQLFQQNILDPIGGTKESYINNRIISNVKSTFIDNLFSTSSKEYLAYEENGVTTSISELTDLSTLEGIDNKYVNAQSPGQKNGFKFTALAIPEGERKTIDFGYADFFEYLMDSWIKNSLPLPLSMSLWKNGTKEIEIKSLFSNYFTQKGDPEGFKEGSYNFQYFEPIDNDDLQKLTTTAKFKILINKLYEGSFVSSSTGLIKLDKQYTEDSSTVLIVPSSKLFDGTYVVPFSAAAWYKFSNSVFGIKDKNVPVLDKIDDSSIMKNFLHYKTTNGNTGNTTGVFYFPYPTEWNNVNTNQKSSVFLGDYENAIGVRDLLDLSKNTYIANGTNNIANSKSQLDNFVLVRNEFGVHIIGIDRLSKMKAAFEATSQGNQTNDFNAKFQRVCNEIRNTFMYYLALDLKSTESTYKIKDLLKEYLTENFESVVFNYIKKVVDDATSNENSLFGAKVTMNPENTIDYNTNFGFVDELNGKNYTNYYKKLNEIVNTNEIRKLLDSVEKLQYAEKSNSFNNQLKDKIYENQSKYNNNSSATKWIDNGIAGVLPFERNSTNGNFISLMQLVNNIVTNQDNKNNSTTIKRYVNSKNNQTLDVVDPNQTITVIDTSSYLKQQKLNYQKSIVSYVNSINLVVSPKKGTGISTYIFTNDNYVNSALLATGSDGALNSIVYNSYIQKYVFPNNKLNINNFNVNTVGSTAWTIKKINDSIKSIYFVNNFVSNKNLYSNGDWKTYDQFLQLATNTWNSNWNENEYKFAITNNTTKTEFNTYNKPSDSESYLKFLVTIRYLLSWNNKENIFEFTRLHSILEESTKVTNNSSGKAMIAWQDVSSIIANPNFGISAPENMSSIQNKMEQSTNFKSLPIYLTNSNSYSWLGQVNPYSLTDTTNGTDGYKKSDISYTNSANYWYSSPIKKQTNGSTSTINNTGFLGFQFEDTSESGITNSIISAAFDNVTYSNALSDSTSGQDVKYRGMLYSYGNRDQVVKYIENLSTVNLLTDFYNKNLKNSSLPITESSKKEIKDIIDSDDINRVSLLQEAIIKVLKNPIEVPNVVFEKMEGMPLWNKEGSISTTLFTSGEETQALKNQYIITQFNSDDVSKLLIKDKDTNISRLNIEQNGFLGLDHSTFFNAIIMLANSSSKIQNQAMDSMTRDIGKIQVYDIRLMNMIDKVWISNYDQWQKIKELK